MIVEDEFVVATHLMACLENMGYTITSSVASGEDAVERVKYERPDLVLMDIVLEGPMTGTQAAEIIRSLYGIPVVFLTANADDNTLERAKKAEPFAFLIKPFRDAELRTTIEVSLYKGSMERIVRESELRFRQLAENIDEVFWTISLDTDGNSYISPAFEKIWGQSANAAMLSEAPFCWIQTIHADDQEAVRNFRKCLESGEISQDEIQYRIIRPDSTVRWIQERAFTIPEGGRKIGRVAGICQDITERFNSDQQREKLIEELQAALGRIETLRGLLSICASCKKIRDEEGAWRDFERYLQEHSKAEFSHCVCPECAKKLYPEIFT